MRNTTRLLFSLLIIALGMTGCDKKEKTQNALPTENTTELVCTVKAESPEATVEEEKPLSEIPDEEPKPAKTSVNATFALNGVKKKPLKLIVNDDHLTVENTLKTAVLINIFDPEVDESAALVPYLSKIKKEDQDVLILGIPDKSLDKQELRSWLETHEADYFISASEENHKLEETITAILEIEQPQLPLTILYRDGKYFSHYEGIIPVEMLIHDIQSSKN